MSTPLRTKDRLVSIIVVWLKRQEFQSVNVKPRNASFAYIVVQGYCYIRYKDFGVDNIGYFIARFIQQLLSVRHGYDIKSMDDDSVFKVIRHHFGKRFIFNQTELFVHISLLLTGIIQYCEFQILVNKQNHHNNKHYNNHIINMDFLNQFKQFVQSKASLRYTDKYDTTKNGSILAIYNIQRASINELAKKYGDYGEINKTSDQKWKICYKQNLFDSRCTILIEFKNPPKVKLVLFLDIIVGSNSDKAAKTGWINANTAAKYDSKELMLSDAIIRAKNDKHLADIIDEYKNKNKTNKNKLFKALWILLKNPNYDIKYYGIQLIHENIKFFNGYQDVMKTTIKGIKLCLIELLHCLIAAVSIIAMHDTKWNPLNKMIVNTSNISIVKQYQIVHGLVMCNACHIISTNPMEKICEMLCYGLNNNNTFILSISSLVQIICQYDVDVPDKYINILFDFIMNSKLTILSEFCPDNKPINTEINYICQQLLSILKDKYICVKHFANQLCGKLINLLDSRILYTKTKYKIAEVLYRLYEVMKLDINDNITQMLIKAFVYLMCDSDENLIELSIGFMNNLIQMYNYDLIVETLTKYAFQMDKNVIERMQMAWVTVISNNLHLSTNSKKGKSVWLPTAMELSLKWLKFELTTKQKYVMKQIAITFVRNYKKLYSNFGWSFLHGQINNILSDIICYDEEFIMCVLDIINEFVQHWDILVEGFENVTNKLMHIINDVNIDCESIIIDILLKCVNKRNSNEMINNILENIVDNFAASQQDFLSEIGINFKKYLQLFESIQTQYPLVFTSYCDKIGYILIGPINKLLSHLRIEPKAELEGISEEYMNIVIATLTSFSSSFNDIIGYITDLFKDALKYEGIVNQYEIKIKQMLRTFSNNLQSRNTNNKQNRNLVEIISTSFATAYNQYHTSESNSETDDDDSNIFDGDPNCDNPVEPPFCMLKIMKNATLSPLEDCDNLLPLSEGNENEETDDDSDIKMT